MKRLNETTGQPFKRGDQREDGKFFLGYQPGLSKKTGFFYENWGCGSYINNYQKEYWKKYPAKRMYLGAKNRADKNNAVCTITEEWVQEKIDKGFCELTGLPFDLLHYCESKNNPYAPSLDRIDSKNKNYTPDNVRVVLSFINIAINDLGLEKALPIFKALIEKTDEKK
jgi:hypothetical protein